MSELLTELVRLRAKRNAVIMAHTYQRAEVQDAADFVGDSLELSQQATKTGADVILFCGVRFMAETAAILCPDKTVLMPDENAGCPMANMITVRELRQKKEHHPGVVVVCYVNSTAAIKAESDICCTSANAVAVVASIPRSKEVVFVPDASLGSYVSKALDRPLILWPGFCPTHHHILAGEVLALKQAHPAAKVTVHPECTEDVIGLADHVGSTTSILEYCHQTDAEEFIVGTEIGILHQLGKQNPGKKFHMLTRLADCPDMKLNTIEKMVWALEDMQPQVRVEPDVASRARQAIERMLAVPRS
jgi:quinolinate synthase